MPKEVYREVLKSTVPPKTPFKYNLKSIHTYSYSKICICKNVSIYSFQNVSIESFSIPVCTNISVYLFTKKLCKKVHNYFSIYYPHLNFFGPKNRILLCTFGHCFLYKSCVDVSTGIFENTLLSKYKSKKNRSTQDLYILFYMC